MFSSLASSFSKLQLSLSTKFTLLLTLVFVIGIVASWALLSRVLATRAEAEVDARGLALIETMNSVRHYTSTQINPLLQDDLAAAVDFIPETVPAYSAREVFETIRQDPAYARYFYKEATLNPTNPRDLADEFERELVNQFRASADLDHLNGFTTRDGVNLYYSARPLTVSAEACLACHSTPDAAPASLINSYGAENGFGWQVGEIIAAQIIYVPAEDVFSSAQSWLNLVMACVIIVFALVILATNLLLRRLVVSPVEQIAKMANAVSASQWSPDAREMERVTALAARKDELGHTAQVFRKMALEVYQREQSLKQKVEFLTIQIDQQKQDQAVKQITESDYFQSLQNRARTLRAANTGGD